MKTIVCVRHGRTAWNADGRFQGIADIPLDDVGRDQVRASAALLAERQFDYAVNSDLTRAVQTMQILLEGRSLVPESDHGWRERNFGAWEGLTWVEITERTPELSGSLSLDVRNFRPEDGEHFEDVKSRVQLAFERVVNRIDDGQSALVVAHAGVLHALLDVLFSGERIATMIAPAGVLYFDIDATGIVLT